jgi:hypothetical protein
VEEPSVSSTGRERKVKAREAKTGDEVADAGGRSPAWGAWGKSSNVRQIDVLGRPFRPSSIVKSVAILTFKFVGTTGTVTGEVAASSLRDS